jgi:hypothetical protein
VAKGRALERNRGVAPVEAAEPTANTLSSKPTWSLEALYVAGPRSVYGEAPQWTLDYEAAAAARAENLPGRPRAAGVSTARRAG